MRAVGLLAGAGVLVASWFAWLASSDRPTLAASSSVFGPRPERAEPAPPGGSPGAGEALLGPGAPAAMPVYAVVGDGSLAAFLAEHGLAPRVGLAVVAGPGLDAPPELAAAARLLGVVAAEAAPDALDGFLAPVAVPADGAWVALLLDGVAHAATAVGPGRERLRFELDGDALLRRLAAPRT